MGHGVVADRPASRHERPPVRQVLLRGPQDEECGHRQVGLPHQVQYLGTRRPAVVHGDVDGPVSRVGEGVDRDLVQRRDGHPDRGLLTVPGRHPQHRPARGRAAGHGDHPGGREADRVPAAQRPGWLGRSGLDTETSTPDAAYRDRVTRSARGMATVSVRCSGRGPSTWTCSRIRVPGGTGTRTAAPSGDCLAGPAPDTTRWLRARIRWPSGPLPGVSRTATVFEAGDSAHATPGVPSIAAAAPWPIQATAKPRKISTAAASTRMSRRESTRSDRAEYRHSSSRAPRIAHSSGNAPAPRRGRRQVGEISRKAMNPRGSRESSSYSGPSMRAASGSGRGSQSRSMRNPAAKISSQVRSSGASQ